MPAANPLALAEDRPRSPRHTHTAGQTHETHGQDCATLARNALLFGTSVILQMEHAVLCGWYHQGTLLVTPLFARRRLVREIAGFMFVLASFGLDSRRKAWNVFDDTARCPAHDARSVCQKIRRQERRITMMEIVLHAQAQLRGHTDISLSRRMG